MKHQAPQFRKILNFAVMVYSLVFFSHHALADGNWSLGSIGGTFDPQAGSNCILVKSVEPSGPGGVAGLQAGDYIYKAHGKEFGVLSSSLHDGYKGAVQDLGEAIERAESTNGVMDISVMRLGTGKVDLTINLPVAGAFGPAYPLGSGKFDAMYQWGCDQIHTRTQASEDFKYATGLHGLILIAHPNWNDTTGAKPYRLSVDKLKDWCVSLLQGREEHPVESVNLDGTPNDGSVNDSNPNDQSYVPVGLENWSIATAAMYLAEYRRKTGDASLDPVLQLAANQLGNRVQDYQQSPYGGKIGITRIGLMGHGGVGGDYPHIGYSGINIINAHALTAMAMLKNAGQM